VIRAIVVIPKDAPEDRFLIIEVEIDCAVCGGLSVRFAGHHLAALHAALGDILGDHPDLCGVVAEEQIKTAWSGMAPGPDKARMN
jgi:hypothetical protein